MKVDFEEKEKRRGGRVARRLTQADSSRPSKMNCRVAHAEVMQIMNEAVAVAT